MFKNIVLINLLIIFSHPENVTCRKHFWRYDFLNHSITSSNRDIFDANIDVVRISRGVYGLSGYVELKEDFDDNYFFEACLHRSANGLDKYIQTPFCVFNHTLTDAMNKFFKGVFMESLRECTTNSVYFEGEFKPPLTKRYMVVDKCQISLDGFPSHMAEGVYKLPVYIHGPVEVCFEAIIRIESIIY